jgi:sugar porter (SP) family MFS transporter
LYFAAAQNTGLSPDAEWRLPLGLQMIPSLILAIGILFCPFSPRWLISQDREEEARDVLLKIRSASHDEIEEEMDRIKAEVAFLRENEIDSYSQLFRAPLRRPLLLGVGIQMLQQLTGINATIYYAPIMFGQLPSANNSITPLLATGVHGSVNVLATIPTIILIDKLGRRVLLIAGAIVMSLSMTIVSILSSLAIHESCNQKVNECSSIFKANLAFIYIFVAGFAFSWGPIAWIYCTEIFPLTMRAKATSLTTAANWVTNCGISFTALWLLQDGHAGAFITSSIFCALMIGIVYFFYPETKDIHLEQNTTIENRRMFVPQWLEDRRTTYNTFQQQPVVANQTHIPVANQQNSINQSNQINDVDSPIERDDHHQEKNLDPNDIGN